MSEIPKRYDHTAAEERWQQFWDEGQIHRWDPTRSREETFVVDTPPPTVSGSLHVGHVFSYTHQDLLVRFRRMKGDNIAYPMGWDDNGLPTERRVQNVLGIRCNPHLPYDPDWKAEKVEGKKKKDINIQEVSRRNFIEACAVITEEDEKAFEHLWRRLGLSLDWSEQYASIDDHCRRVSQFSLLDLVEKDQVYNLEAPNMWDVDFKTAVAQAEVEDRPQQGFFHDIRFGVQGGGELLISTTRPELLAACIAVVAHPDDERYQGLFGKFAVTPLYGARVPILAAEHADPEKGTGILMVCTFGDAMDVEWWKQDRLPVKQVVGRNGRLMPVVFGEAPFESTDPAVAQAAYDQIAGLTAKQAKKVSAELLAQEGSFPGGGVALKGELRSTDQMVKFYEKGDRPLEFVATRQWFVKILEHKDALLEQGKKIQWHPSHMQTRYDHWVEGLNQDWCISRQRYFGVPFPVWYRVGVDGEPQFDEPIFALPDTLPVDPLSDVPPGFDEKQRDQPGGFSGDPDVMDTWATSSLTPQIQSYWGVDAARHEKLFPMDVRPQSHEIIRTWAFYTIVKAWMHSNEVPWHHVVISGWILDPDRKKMSKSKGNVVTPEGLLDEWTADGVRYWTARARLGTDTAFDPGVFKVGKRLVNKVFNASRFVLLQVERVSGEDSLLGVEHITEPLDLAFVERLRGTIAAATDAFEAFDYATALQVAEDDFWRFCDHYLELVKLRSYAEEDTAGRRSAIAALTWGLKTFLRLLAPFLPFVTEEVWSWRFAAEEGRERSIHTSAWPIVGEVDEAPRPQLEGVYEAAVELLAAVRGAKTIAQKSLRWPVAKIEIVGPEIHRKALETVLEDVMRAGHVSDNAVSLEDGPSPEATRFAVNVVLAEEMAE
ncbi:MAG: valine--tRNA ligase [Thermoanaerobaculales bacterium]|nr:valine--tRNA ligase [Thermoanaerobaculales bacterium]